MSEKEEQSILTDRQQREAEYYDQYAQVRQPAPIDFAPVMPGPGKRWNPYWYVFQLVRDLARPERKNAAEKSQTLLDFGCGDGSASMLYAKAGFAVEGFDISAANVALSEESAKVCGFADRCKFRRMSAEHLEYEDASLDVVVGIDVLHHVEIASAIREIHRVLRGDGVAIFKEPVHVALLDDLVRKAHPRKKSFSPEHHITEDERKLSPDDLAIIRSSFQSMEMRRFGLTSRLSRFLPWGQRLRPYLQRLDAILLRLPLLRQLGDEVVIVCRK